MKIPERPFIKTHLSAFLGCEHCPQKWVGKNIRRWANQVGKSLGSRFNLDNDKLTRRELGSLCRDTRTPDEACFLAVMAWGGMRLDHARSVWTGKRAWLPILKLIRKGDLSRRDCYAKFAALRHSGNLPGMGACLFHQTDLLCQAGGRRLHHGSVDWEIREPAHGQAAGSSELQGPCNRQHLRRRLRGILQGRRRSRKHLWFFRWRG